MIFDDIFDTEKKLWWVGLISKPFFLFLQAVDLSKYDYEIYMGETQFFNNRHLFVMFVMEHKNKPVFEYIRPDGVYWEMLNKKYQGGDELWSSSTD